MKLFIFFLLLLPFFTAAQRSTESFGRFINTDGTVIKGSSLVRGYERLIEVNKLESNSTTNSTSIRFEMPIGEASGIFRSLINSKQVVSNGEIIVTELLADKRIVQYKITMENIAVTACSDANGFTRVQLNATRIGWTYYSYNQRSGVAGISSKTGWDASTKSSWTNF